LLIRRLADVLVIAIGARNQWSGPGLTRMARGPPRECTGDGGRRSDERPDSDTINTAVRLLIRPPVHLTLPRQHPD
jgi:hypothetical protein